MSHKIKDVELPDTYLEKWQTSIDTLAKIIDVPAALIMEYKPPFLEVFLSSQTSEENPYKPGDKEIQTGLYCETVISSQEELDVPNALTDPEWDDNPDLELDMINYLGLPLNWPDGKPFGTICILDKKERNYSQMQKKLLAHFSDMIENYLHIIYDQVVISSQKEQIDKLENLLSICSYCKRVRDTENERWIDIESYIMDNFSQSSTHGICESCFSGVISKMS